MFPTKEAGSISAQPVRILGESHHAKTGSKEAPPTKPKPWLRLARKTAVAKPEDISVTSPRELQTEVISTKLSEVTDQAEFGFGQVPQTRVSEERTSRKPVKGQLFLTNEYDHDDLADSAHRRRRRREAQQHQDGYVEDEQRIVGPDIDIESSSERASQTKETSELTKRIGQLTGEIVRLMKLNGSLEHELQTEIKTRDEQLTSYLNHITTLEGSNSQRQEEITGLRTRFEEAKKKHAHEIKDLEQSHDKFVRQLEGEHSRSTTENQRGYRQEIAELTRRLQQTSREHEREATLLKDEHSRATEMLKESHRKALADSTAAHEQRQREQIIKARHELEAMRNRTDEAMGGLNKNHQSEMDKVQRELHAARKRIDEDKEKLAYFEADKHEQLQDQRTLIADLENALDKEISKRKEQSAEHAKIQKDMAKAHQVETAKLMKEKTAFEEEFVVRFKTEMASAIDFTEKKYSKAMEEIRTSNEKGMNELKQVHAGEIEKLVNVHQKEKQKLLTELAERDEIDASTDPGSPASIQDISRRHMRELRELKVSQEQMMATITQKYTVILKAQEEEHQNALQDRSQEIELFKQKQDRKMEHLKQESAMESSRRIEHLEQDHEKMMADLKQMHASQEAQKIQELRQDHTIAMEALKQAHAAERSTMIEEVKNMKTDLEAKQSTIIKSVKQDTIKMKADLEAEQSRAVENLHHEYQRRIESLEQMQTAKESQHVSDLKVHQQRHEKILEDLKQKHAEDESMLKGLMQEHVEEKSQQIQSLQQKYNTTMENLRQQHATMESQLTQTYESRGKQAMAVHEREIAHLRAEVRELNEAVSSQDGELYLSSLFPAVPMRSDEKCSNDFLTLHRMVEEVGDLAWEAWKDDVLERPVGEANGQFPPRKLKASIIQHIIWVQLFNYVFISPFRMFGEVGLNLEKEWAVHCEPGQSPVDNEYASPSPGFRTERWRWMTMTGCRDALKSRMSQFDPRAPLKKGFGDTIQSLRTTLKTELGAVTDIDDREDINKLIQDLPTKAARIWLDFSAQRCRLVIHPELESTSPVDVAALFEKGSTLSVRPALGRYGDWQGLSLETFTVIPGCERETMEIHSG